MSGWRLAEDGSWGNCCQVVTNQRQSPSSQANPLWLAAILAPVWALK